MIFFSLQVQDKIGDREQKLRIALTEAEQLHSSMTAMNDWLNSAESYLGCLEHVSRIPDTVEKQMNEHIKFQAEVKFWWQQKCSCLVDLKGIFFINNLRLR